MDPVKAALVSQGPHTHRPALGKRIPCRLRLEPEVREHLTHPFTFLRRADYHDVNDPLAAELRNRGAANVLHGHSGHSFPDQRRDSHGHSWGLRVIRRPAGRKLRICLDHLPTHLSVRAPPADCRSRHPVISHRMLLANRAAPGPPCPRGASAQRKECEPQIQDGHSEESAAERDAVVKHEAYDPAVRDGAELPGGHAEKRDVVREEFAPRRQEYREGPGEQQGNGCQGKSRPAVPDELSKQSAIVVRPCHSYCRPPCPFRAAML